MLKPGEPGGSAFLKVDPAYLQHWQQLFPQSGQLKSAGALAQLQPPERAEPPADSLRQRPASLSSASSSSSSSTPSSSSTSSCVAAAAASLAGLSALPVAQLPVFAPLQSSEPPAGGAPAPLQGKDLCGAGGTKCGERPAARFRCTAEELDYYLYGQQRMEIIPLNQHTSDPNNRTYRHPHPQPRTSPRLSSSAFPRSGTDQAGLGALLSPPGASSAMPWDDFGVAPGLSGAGLWFSVTAREPNPSLEGRRQQEGCRGGRLLAEGREGRKTVAEMVSERDRPKAGPSSPCLCCLAPARRAGAPLGAQKSAAAQHCAAAPSWAGEKLQFPSVGLGQSFPSSYLGVSFSFQTSLTPR